MNDGSCIASFDAAAPGFICGFLRVSGCSGEADRPLLERLRATIGEEVRARWGGKGKSAFREDPVLEAYRRFYGRFGNSYFVQLQLETAAKGEKPIPLDIPLVSVMFLGELRHRILTATHDASSLRLPVSVGEADGTQIIRRMGGTERTLKPGDLFMADGEGVISSVLAGPDERTRVTERTTDAVYATYVPPGVGERVLAAYIDDLECMIRSIYPASRIDGRWILGTQTGGGERMRNERAVPANGAGTPAKKGTHGGEALRRDAERIVMAAIDECLPEPAVRRALAGRDFAGKIVLVSVGKAAWRMADAAVECLGDRIERGVVVTKYDHSRGPIRDFRIIEAGHPVPDENSLRGAEAALDAVNGLTERDTVLFLVSGGGSALFERPLPGVGLADVENITRKLLESGADIREINTLRKRLSSVKAGRFALAARPARVLTLALSDVLGDRMDTIASGPTVPDETTSGEAMRILGKYGISVSDSIRERLSIETPKELPTSECVMVGSVRMLCEHAEAKARELGYNVAVLTTSLNCEAREAGRFLASIAREEMSRDQPFARPCALIAGGETVVRVTGNGLGGRNQELALSAACALENVTGVVLLSVGSDGSDGPTDAAGGFADGGTTARIRAAGGSPEDLLGDNDSRRALEHAGDLVKTGPTGTNVNDIALVLCGEPE